MQSRFGNYSPMSGTPASGFIFFMGIPRLPPLAWTTAARWSFGWEASAEEEKEREEEAIYNSSWGRPVFPSVWFSLDFSSCPRFLLISWLPDAASGAPSQAFKPGFSWSSRALFRLGNSAILKVCGFGECERVLAISVPRSYSVVMLVCVPQVEGYSSGVFTSFGIVMFFVSRSQSLYLHNLQSLYLHN